MAYPPVLVIVDGTTVLNAAWASAFTTDLASAIQNATAQTPAQSTTELQAARLGKADLTTLLRQLFDESGNIVNLVTPSALRNGFALGNLLANDSFLMWPAGDAAAPAYWSLSGAGAAIARCGPGQADTTILKNAETAGSNQAHWAAKLTFGAAAAVLSQRVLAAAAVNQLDAMVYRFRPVDAAGNPLPQYGQTGADSNINTYLIGHVKTDATNRARLRISDGGTTFDSPYHPSGEWATLIAAGQRSINPVIGYGPLDVQCRVEIAGSAYFQCLSLIATPLELPPMYVPGRYHYRTLKYYANNPATGVLDYFPFSRPAYILGAQMQCLTAGTVTAPTIDLLTPIAGVYSSLFTTLPTIATGQLVGAAQACDPAAANYRRKTIMPALAASATQVDNTSLRLDYVDDGGNTLRDLMVTIHYLEQDLPYDQFRAISDIGV